MPIIVGRQGPVGDTEKFVGWLDSLAVDITKISRGKGPSRAELEQAPLLASAHFAMRPLSCLVNAGGKDVLGPVMNGNHVWVIAPDEGWVRTLSGYYRLAPSSVGRH